MDSSVANYGRNLMVSVPFVGATEEFITLRQIPTASMAYLSGSALRK